MKKTKIIPLKILKKKILNNNNNNKRMPFQLKDRNNIFLDQLKVARLLPFKKIKTIKIKITKMVINKIRNNNKQLRKKKKIQLALKDQF